MLFDTIMLDQKAKFERLPSLISEWLSPVDDTMITQLDYAGQEGYVSTMREIMDDFAMKPISFIAEGDDIIGSKSIHLKDLVQRFGKRVAHVLFEEISISVKLKATIISYGTTTIELMRKICTIVREGVSEFKRLLRDQARVKKGLQIMQCAMSLQIAQEFVNQSQMAIDKVSLATQAAAIANFGVLIVGNG